MSKGEPFRPRASDRVHGDVLAERPSVWKEVYDLVRRIPRGRVMTYGQISDAMIAGLSPRAVGWALHGSPKGVPWQRVVNASGGCSTDRLGDFPPGLQRALLEAEGVEFRATGRLDLDLYRWSPGRRRAGSTRRRKAGSPRASRRI